MCCRYVVEDSPELRPIWEAAGRSPLAGKMAAAGKALKGPGEIRPADTAPALATARSGGQSVFPMRWGFSGPSGLMINARSETAAVRGMFAEAWRAHRCALPASCYVEWEHLTTPNGRKKTGAPYRIRPENQSMLWLAGLYRIEDGLPHFTVLTREPAEEIRWIHNRMPVILSPAQLRDWIRPGADPAAVLRSGAPLPRMLAVPDAELPLLSLAKAAPEAPARYVCFDVETPNHRNDRMSAIGIAVVERGKITEEFFSYVNPEEPFDAFNTQLTGISAATVAQSPTFPMLWPKLEPLLSGGILVAHNAPFDLSVLKSCLRAYGIAWRDTVPYLCTVRIGRALLPDRSHRLNELCAYYGIPLDHHRADSDSHACAEILIRYGDVSRFLRSCSIR